VKAKATQVYVLFSNIIILGGMGKGFVYILTADDGGSDRMVLPISENENTGIIAIIVNMG